jgi:hypothetical protein
VLLESWVRDQSVPDDRLKRLRQWRHEPRIWYPHYDDFIPDPFGVPAIAAHNPKNLHASTPGLVDRPHNVGTDIARGISPTD